MYHQKTRTTRSCSHKEISNVIAIRLSPRVPWDLNTHIATTKIMVDSDFANSDVADSDVGDSDVGDFKSMTIFGCWWHV